MREQSRLSLCNPELVRNPVLRKAFDFAKKEMLDPSISDAEFEQLHHMTRAEMRARIDDYEHQCVVWEVLGMLDGHRPEGAQVVTPVGYRKKPISAKLRWAVFKRDEYRCQTCGSEEDLAADHIHSEALGGQATLDNLQTLCRRCNGRKGPM